MDRTEPAPFDSAGFLKNLTHRPGVYRMLGVDQELLYVGKAKDLKKRVTSYFRNRLSSPRIRAMVAQIQSMEVTVTHTEAEALLLENNLIKAHHPRYNVLLRDDKSYPYIFVSQGNGYPRIGFHRGPRKSLGRYFGPYPSAQAVRETLSTLQRLFRVRQCEDSFFANRSRPCLQYQIKRCTAPCVGFIEPMDYQGDIARAIQFLEGRSSDLINELVGEMEQASAVLAFERAARYRDQIDTLRQISERQYVSSDNGGDIDLVALARAGDNACVQVFCIRGGRNLGNKALYPKIPADIEAAEAIQAFLEQYYLDRDTPAEIIVTPPPSEADILAEVLSAQVSRRVVITSAVRGQRARWLSLAAQNAEQALHARQAGRANVTHRLEALQAVLALDQAPARIECFDISHTRGEAAVASCVVFGTEGAVKSDYRRFNIEGITPGDDYAAMHQALTRRYSRLKSSDGAMPDVLLIDGGRGQVHEAERVLEELQINDVVIVGITKGEGRRPEFDTLTLSRHGPPVRLPSHHLALHLVQQIRDEAHRFAISGHRQRRTKARTTSPLQSIPGLGPKRRQQVLMHFGGLRGIARAGIEELAKAPGISRRLAEQIYEHFHGDAG
ncbi:excinuclease ABC subunit C [Acidihalobacter yilgarnensis]|uniref:UvrABC system protein C n=1 Tax=Acidihalobacter yilgarnensis TaxID=2819280 RepID=A0A1D8INL3_9GAMM|nr:excinuclease ABC subunit UvrC [Acidihalobacter yilgarnensis]AOU98001.1 excinuclease ABC subunit C [Acidihalobacter yilgarnensis]